ncbi:unnamed protein product [Schistosoma rodhaini]|nr:unnamed protein product [Schistosoma rodhaini]
MIIATIIQWYKHYTIHSCMYTFMSTYILTSFHIYWLVYFLDSNAITKNPELNKLPLYYMHLINSMGLIMIITDAVLWKPKRIPFIISYIPCCIFMTIYIVYLEIINVINNYTELLDSNGQPITCRVIYYSLFWLIITIFNASSCGIIRLLNLKK